MKKRFVISLMTCAMLLLVACGKENVKVDTPNDVISDETDEENESEKEVTGTLQLVDCFALTGKGYIITGDVVSGVICVGDEAVIVKEDGTEIEIKVVELQMRQESENPEEAVEGEFVGVLVDLPERIEISSNDKMNVYGK
jgi:translation elongation factor EF-Tu-like GTPase